MWENKNTNKMLMGILYNCYGNQYRGSLKKTVIDLSYDPALTFLRNVSQNTTEIPAL